MRNLVFFKPLKERSGALYWVGEIVQNVISSLLISAILFVLGTSLFGFKPFDVATGSMVPVITPRDVVYCKTLSTYSKGDVVTYTKNGTNFTHRIVGIYDSIVASNININEATIVEDEVTGQEYAKIGNDMYLIYNRPAKDNQNHTYYFKDLLCAYNGTDIIYVYNGLEYNFTILGTSDYIYTFSRNLETTDGASYVVTKGDAVNDKDPPITTNMIKGKVFFKFSGLGKTMEYIKTHVMMIVLVILALYSVYKFLMSELEINQENIRFDSKLL